MSRHKIVKDGGKKKAQILQNRLYRAGMPARYIKAKVENSSGNRLGIRLTV
jgi:hypothetical protein